MPSPSVSSYLFGSVSELALLWQLARRWRSRTQGSLLIVAVGATVVWAGTLAAFPEAGETRLPVLVAELAKSVTWAAFVARALGGTESGRAFWWLRVGILLVATTALAVGIVAALNAAPAFGYLTVQRTTILSGLLLAILGLVLVEQALRNTRATQVWSTKLLWFGVGSLFAYDAILYATSAALDGVEPVLWQARGLAVAMTAPLIAVSVSRIESFNSRLVMSQRFTFYTTSMILGGVYLVTTLIAGEYVRIFGGAWGRVLQVVLAFGALLALVTALSSGLARAHLRVFLSKHLFRYRYDYRNEWLELTTKLARDVDGSSLDERTLAAFSDLLKTNGGGVWVASDEALVPTVGTLAGSDAAVERIDSEFCRFLERNEWVVDLDEVRAQGPGAGGVPVPAWLRNAEDARLAIPLLHEGKLVGLVVLQRQPISERLTWEEIDLLRTAGRQAASYFALQQAADALSRERQFAAMNRLTTFLVHDLSNIVAQQRLIVANARQHKSNPAFIDDAIDTIENAASRTERLLEQLRSGGQLGEVRQVRIAEACRNALQRVSGRAPVPTLEVEDEGAYVLVASDRLEHVIEHLVRNAQEATPVGGAVVVRVRSEGDTALIEITDTGAGMGAGFVLGRLFEPFTTTKAGRGMGIGAFQARELVRAAGGDVTVNSARGVGTTFVVRLPRH
jgi:putative PEP-CTERM system histidine kinase